MREQQKACRSEEEVGVICRHLINFVSVLDVCDDNGLHPTVYYRWQNELFESGAGAPATQKESEVGGLTRRLSDAEDQLTRKKEVLAEVVEEYLRCEKTVGAVDGPLGEAGAAR